MTLFPGSAGFLCNRVGLGRDIGVLQTGILNPAINSLLCRIRHTNTLVIADRGFPFWPQVETIDLALVDDIPQVLDVLRAIRKNFVFAQAFMAEEFLSFNSPVTQAAFAEALHGVATRYEPHVVLKKRVPSAVGLIRTADTTQYANLILESG
jgi:D-ribose pyranase